MKNFKDTLIRSIKRKRRTREEYETMVADWTEAGLLTTDEALEVMTILDEYYPVEDAE